MIRLVIVLRTWGKDIKSCLFYNKCCAPVTLDSREQYTRICLPIKHNTPDFWSLELEEERSTLHPADPRSKSKSKGRHSKSKCRWLREVEAARPHRRMCDIVFFSDPVTPEPSESVSPPSTPPKTAEEEDYACGVVASEDIPERDSLPSDQNGVTQFADTTDNDRNGGSGGGQWSVRFVPITKCTLLLNGHLASCVAKSATSSQRFRRRLLKNLIQAGGMEEFSTQSFSVGSEAEVAFDLVMEVTYFIDIVAVWPEQRIDYSW